MADVVLVPVDPALRDAVLATAPHPEQEVFSGRAADTLPLAEADPRRHPYAVLERGAPVGFFVLDSSPSAVDPAADLLLRGFYVDAAAQGRGVAKAAAAQLAVVVRRDLPAARSVVLTVNVRNPGARAVYLSAGFVDTGRLHLGGSAGPQHVLRLEVPERRGGGAGTGPPP